MYQAQRFLVRAPMAGDLPPKHLDGGIGFDRNHLLLFHRLDVDADHAFRDFDPRLLLYRRPLGLLLLVMDSRLMLMMVNRLRLSGLMVMMAVLSHLRLNVLYLGDVMSLQMLLLE